MSDKIKYSNNSINSRDSNIELLRIIAMIFIVFSHIAAHGNHGVLQYSKVSMNSIFVELLKFGGGIGDNIFILITGYYSIKSKFKISKVISLILQVTFYSTLLTLLSYVLDYNNFSIKLLIKSCIPFISGNWYWFIIAYIEIY